MNPPSDGYGGLAVREALRRGVNLEITNRSIAL